MGRRVTDRLLVPIANDEDAERTCESIRRYFEGDDHRPTVVAVHVIEKGGGAIDKAPLDARKEQASESFEVVRSVLGAAGYDVETELVYGTNVVEAILDAVAETEATAIAFLPREGGFLVRFLTGNTAKKLMTDAPVPVITFPNEGA